MVEWLNIVIDLIENRPTVMVVLLLMVAIGWLVKRLADKDKIVRSKDSTISSLNRALMDLHRAGTILDESTQILAGIRDSRRKTKR